MLHIEDIDLRFLKTLLPHPKPDANKYTRGKLVVVGGSAEYPGAACLASAAAERMGAGYVEVFCAKETAAVIHGYRPSIVARCFDREGIAAALEQPHAQDLKGCLIGSGLDGNDPGQQGIALSAMQHAEVPMVVDGGGISALATQAGLKLAAERAHAGLATVVTPHFGEATRLATAASVDVPDPRGSSAKALAAFAKQLADSYAGIIVLKGPSTYIATCSSDVVHAMGFGTPALAKAGTGDVLAGMTSSLLAQGLRAEDASMLGASLHALAGRAAEAEQGDISVIPEDLIDRLPRAICEL